MSFAAATRAAHLSVVWWALPLALTLGWAFSQALTGSILVLRNRGEDPAPAVLPGVTAAFVGPALLALLGVRLYGGGVGVVVTVAVFSLYVSSLGVLLERREAALVAAALGPSLVVSVAYLAGANGGPMRAAVLAAVALTVVSTLVAAVRHGRLARWSPARLARHERWLVLTFFTYGACSGLAVSAVAVVAQGAHGLGPVFLVTLPVMATIGVVEWQLHTYRSKVTGALVGSSNLAVFERRAVRGFVHSTSWYLAALLAATAAVAVGAAAAGYPLASWPLAAEDAVGLTLFVGLVAATCNALDLAVRSWLAGVVAFGLGLVVLHATGLAADHTALDAVTLAAAVVALVSMMLSALAVLRLPFHYQV